MPIASKHQRLNKGSFSKIHYVKDDGTFVALEWLYCREYFQDESAGIKRFLFCHKPHKCKHMAHFLNKIEEKLNLQERTCIGPSQRNNISWVRVSSWWTKTSMKRSLFTALLRCSHNYNYKKDNFDEALLSTIYIKHTEYAVRRFLDGYTKYTGKRKGWYNQFRWGGGTFADPKLPTKDQIDKLLIFPNLCKNNIYTAVMV